MAASRLAKGLFHQIGRVPGGTRFLAGGGKDLIRQSVPGSVITAGLTTLATGNPIAGLLVGGTDLALSAGLARGLATNRATNVARKITGDDKTTLGGKFVNIRDAATKKRYGEDLYHASIPQNIAMLGGSVAATVAIEPHFYPKGQNTVQGQQLTQMKYVNNLNPTTAHGTMYQTQGIPIRSV
tara:strand:+ start:59 stop:607 length:549 start_codon:yes stop_codon:yes gene_type:complete